jgi:site-specific DNA-methyltransferase (adenine-specific)
MEAMKEMPDKAFALAIVDPPYAVGASDGTFGRGGAKSRIKEYRADLKHYANHDLTPGREYFLELFRVSKNQIIWGANYYPEYLYHSGWIVWDKVKSDGWLSEAELAFQSLDKRVKIFKHEWEGFRRAAGSFEQTLARTIHPNQKPVRLYEWCLSNYAKPGDNILDTHLGSGSIAIACNRLGYDLTGYELDAEYFEKAKKRLEEHKKQGQLFDVHV